MDILLSEEALKLLGGLLAALVAFVIRKWLKGSVKEKILMAGIEVAYLMVSELAKRTETKVDDKVALALQYLREWLGTHGEELKPVDEAKAKMLFTAMHGKEKLAGK